jgi:hypothetical protein
MREWRKGIQIGRYHDKKPKDHVSHHVHLDRELPDGAGGCICKYIHDQLQPAKIDRYEQCSARNVDQVKQPWRSDKRKRKDILKKAVKCCGDKGFHNYVLFYFLHSFDGNARFQNLFQMYEFVLKEE